MTIARRATPACRRAETAGKAVAPANLQPMATTEADIARARACPPERAAAPRRDRVPRGHEDLHERRRGRRRRLVHRPPRRVRVPRGLDRLGQVDAHPPAHQGDRADRGHDPRRRARPGGDLAREDAALPAQPRRRLPGLQAPAQPHGARQRRLRAAGHRRHAQGDPRQGARHPAPDRAVDEAPQLPRAALRRRAAARLDRARVRQPPAAAAGRRAHRQPRPRDLDRDHAAALPDQPHRHDGRRRHARLTPWSTACAAA